MNANLPGQFQILRLAGIAGLILATTGCIFPRSYPENWAPRENNTASGCPDISGIYVRKGEQRAVKVKKMQIDPLVRNDIDKLVPPQEHSPAARYKTETEIETIECKAYQSKCILSRVLLTHVLVKPPHDLIKLDQVDNDTVKVALIHHDTVVGNYELHPNRWSCDQNSYNRSISEFGAGGHAIGVVSKGWSLAPATDGSLTGRHRVAGGGLAFLIPIADIEDEWYRWKRYEPTELDNNELGNNPEPEIK